MSIAIKIKSIKEEEFKFSDLNLNEIDSDHLLLGFHLNFKVNVEENIFSVKLTVVYNYEVKEEENPLELMKYTTVTTFDVKKLKEIVKFDEEDSDKYDIPDSLMVTFVGTAVSSTRGMLVNKLSGTILSSFYLPLVDIKELLNLGLKE